MADRYQVLLVEDSLDCQSLVTRSLEGSAQVTIASDLKSARKLLESNRFDVMLLDVGLPDGDGFGFCSSILTEQGPNRPRILFLTGNSKSSDKLTGFTVGADDYVVKPFDPLELKARVQAHLRHRREITEAAQAVRVGNLELNLVNYFVEVKTESGPAHPSLTPSEFRLLYQLAKNEGRVVTREQILSSLSEDNLDVSDRSVDVHISRLRKKLLGCSHSIESIYGVGYRLNRCQEVTS